MTILDIQTGDVSAREIIITDSAISAVRELMEKRELEGFALRVYVAGGGCSGYQYGMALDDNIRETDRVYMTGDIKVVVDEISINYLTGSTIDYVDDLMASGFKIENPNAIASCGCGNSFRTQESSSPTAEGNCC